MNQDMISREELQQRAGQLERNRAQAKQAMEVASGGDPILRLSQADGDFIYGVDADVATGEMMVLPDSMVHGWVAWKSSKIIDSRMSSWFSGEEIIPKSELPQYDFAPKTPDGWQHSVGFLGVLRDDEVQVRFSSQTNGGQQAFDSLCEAYIVQLRQGVPGVDIPIIRLESEFYINKKQANKKIWKPLFPIARWVSRDDLAAGNFEPAVKPVEDQSEHPRRRRRRETVGA